MTQPTIVLSPLGRRPLGLDQSQVALSAAGTPWGDIEVRGHADPIRLTITAGGLPSIDLVAPTRIGGPRLRCAARATRLSVGAVAAVLTQRASGLTYRQ